MKNVPTIKSVPSFTKSANAIVKATEAFDGAGVKFAAAVVIAVQTFLDACSIAGIKRDNAGCAAIGKAISDNETMVKASQFDGTLLQKTVTEYAQSAKRAYFHNVPFTQGLKNDPEFKIPKANGDASKPTGPKAGGKIQSTNRAELDKTICKLLTQARLIGLTAFAADILDVCLDGLDGFAEVQDAPL
jgi:hypothetical protein